MNRRDPDGRDYFMYRDLTHVNRTSSNRQWFSAVESPTSKYHSSPQRPRTVSPQPERTRVRVRTEQHMKPMGPDRLKQLEDSLHALEMEEWRSEKLLDPATQSKDYRLHDTQESRFSSLSAFSVGTDRKSIDSYAMVKSGERYIANSFPNEYSRTDIEATAASRPRISPSTAVQSTRTEQISNGGRDSRARDWKSTGNYQLDFESLVNRRSLSPPRQNRENFLSYSGSVSVNHDAGHLSGGPLVRTPRTRIQNNVVRSEERRDGPRARDLHGSRGGGWRADAPILTDAPRITDAEIDLSASPAVLSRYKPEYQQSPPRTFFRPGTLLPGPSPQLNLNLAAVEAAGGHLPVGRVSNEWGDLEGISRAKTVSPPSMKSTHHDASGSPLATAGPSRAGLSHGQRDPLALSVEQSPVLEGSSSQSPPPARAPAGVTVAGAGDSRTELAQQLLDQMLGQYFAKAQTFRELMAADVEEERAVGAAEGAAGGRVGWLEWWMRLEREVRGAIKPEMKAVYDTRCRELFMRTRLHFRALFDRHGAGDERALTMAEVKNRSEPEVWALYASHTQALGPGQGGRLSWQRFWEDAEPLLKAAIKEHMKQLVKQEMTVKFTQWRRSFHAVFRDADPSSRGVVDAVELASALRASALGLVLALPPPDHTVT